MNYLRYITTFSLLTFALLVRSQLCDVTIVSPTSDSLDCGECVELVADGIIYDTLLQEDFNNQSLGIGWSSTGNVTYSNPCGPSLDGTPSAWFGNNPPPRELITVDYDLSCGGRICFDLDFAGDDNGSNSCEDPDEADEGVYFQYSIDAGVSWVTIFYFNPLAFTIPNGYYSWDNYCFDVPLAAQTSSTRLRWFQDSPTSNVNDHWGIDNVFVLGDNCNNNYYYDWLVNGIAGDQDTTVCLTTNSETFDVIFTNGIDDTCSASKTLVSTLNAGLNINDTTICGLIDYDLVANPLNGSGNYDFLWNTGETTNTANSVTTGQYIVTITDQNFPNCTASDTANFIMNPLVDVDFSADPLCQGALTNFTDLTNVPTGYNIESWSWNFGNQGNTSTDQNPSYEYSGVDTYQVTLSVNTGEGCISDTTLTISIEPAPFANFNFDLACEGEEIFFENASLGNYDNSEWIFETNENDTIFTQNAAYTFPAEGPYTATLIIDRSNGACTDTVTKVVDLIPGPDVFFTTSTNTGEAPLFVEFYNESNGAVGYLWDFANGNSENTLNDTVSEVFDNAGQYPVTLFGTSIDDCTASHTEVIFVEYPDLLVEIPNIFTPNGDGVNDEFFINYIDAKETITSFNIEIVNRWGNLITESNDPDFKWDGRTLGGTLVNDGSYFYIITFSTLKEDNIVKQGFVQLESD